MTDGLFKIIRLDERFPETGEPTIQILSQTDLTRIKIASEASDYVKTVQPVPGKTIILVLAMSAGEYYGPNRNGDAFAERVVPGKIERGETLPEHYKSFETGAHVYRHHVNKDPAKSLGKVLRAFYNWEMHRVELLLELDNDLAHDVVDRINRGEYPAVSMGCKIRYDVCDICGNKAPTRAQYCDHAKYEMNRVYPDGRKSFVWNPSPNLFDISIVIRPADRIGYMMKKVAHDNAALALAADEGEKIADIQEKLSTLKKLSDIDKVIRGQTVDFEPKTGPVHNFVQSALPGLMARSPGLDNQALSDLSSVPLPEALSTLGGLGITPTSGEITCIIIKRALPGKDVPPHMLQNISNFSGGALELLRQNPDVLNAVLQSGLLDIGPDKVNPQLAQKMAAWQEKRANTIEYLGRRIFQEPHPMVGNWEMVNGTDQEGRPFKTTRGAIDAADDANVGRQLKTLGGVSLLTGAAYKALSAHPTGKYMAPLAVAAGGLTLGNVNKRYKGQRIGNTGKVPVDTMTGEMWEGGAPVNAEMKVGSALPAGNFMNIAIPGVSSAAVTAMLAQEYNQRLQQGQLGQNPDVFNKTVEGLGSVAYRHPAATFLAGLAGIGVGAHTLGNVGRFISKSAEDSVKLAAVDLDGLCLWLGEGLFEFGKT